MGKMRATAKAAEHCRDLLQGAFPGVCFSVRASDEDTLTVAWQDGPIPDHVRFHLASIFPSPGCETQASPRLVLERQHTAAVTERVRCRLAFRYGEWVVEGIEVDGDTLVGAEHRVIGGVSMAVHAEAERELVMVAPDGALPAAEAPVPIGRGVTLDWLWDTTVALAAGRKVPAMSRYIAAAEKVMDRYFAYGGAGFATRDFVAGVGRMADIARSAVVGGMTPGETEIREASVHVASLVGTAASVLERLL